MGHDDDNSSAGENTKFECKDSSDIIDDESEPNILKYGSTDGIGYWESVSHMIRATVGTGILLLPLQMKNLGFITGTLLLVAVSFVYLHIIHILLYLDYRLRTHFKLKRLTYALIVDKIFAIAPTPFRKCRQTLLFIIYIYYMVPINDSIKLIIISNNIREMAKYHGSNLNFIIVITILTLVLTTFCLFRSILKILVPFSSASNLCSFAIAIIIVTYSIMYRNPYAVVRPFAGDISLVLRGMAIYLNSVPPTEIILPVSNAMKEPHKMVALFGSLNATACIIVIYYSVFALIAYMNFGDQVRENVLSNIPVSDLLILSINLVYSLALSVPYVLSFYVSLDVIWSSKFKNKLADSKYKCMMEYGIRIGYNSLAYFIAIGVSNLELISAIAGLFGILLDVAIMPFLQLLLMYVFEEKNDWILYKNIFLIFICSLLFLLSLIDCVDEVAKLYAS